MPGFTKSLQLGGQRLGGQSRHRDGTASANPGARAHGGLYGLLQHRRRQHAFRLRGLERLALSPASSISKVAFFIDGALEWTEHVTPYVYNGDSGQLNTRTLANGPHVLMVKATASNGSTASIAVTVSITARHHY
ncbi:MAG: hypothetical protein JO114_12720 [Planctomycetaceae bacterium]|nr:hypothetical protein [Planctomycetaceae bacterium]